MYIFKRHKRRSARQQQHMYWRHSTPAVMRHLYTAAMGRLSHQLSPAPHAPSYSAVRQLCAAAAAYLQLLQVPHSLQRARHVVMRAGAVEDEPKLQHAQLAEAGDDADLAGRLQRVVGQSGAVM